MEAFRTCSGFKEAIEEKFIGVKSRVSRVEVTRDVGGGYGFGEV